MNSLRDELKERAIDIACTVAPYAAIIWGLFCAAVLFGGLGTGYGFYMGGVN